MKRKIAISLIFILAFSTTLMQDNQVDATATGQPMKKYVTEQATFVLYMPEGWKVSEGAQENFKTLFVTDPGGLYTRQPCFMGSARPGRTYCPWRASLPMGCAAGAPGKTLSIDTLDHASWHLNSQVVFPKNCHIGANLSKYILYRGDPW